MPTPEQTANVMAQIEALQDSRYEAFSAVAARPYFVNAPDKAPGWGKLNEEQRLYVLTTHVNWDGFTQEEELDAMQTALIDVDPDLIADAERTLHDVKESYWSYDYREEFPAASDIRMHLTGEFAGPTWDELDRDTKEMLLGKALGLDGAAYQVIDGVAAHEANRLINAFLDAEERDAPGLLDDARTPEETQKLVQEWRDDASQRPLMEKGVRYEDAPAGQTKPDSYDQYLDQMSSRGSNKSKDRVPER